MKQYKTALAVINTLQHESAIITIQWSQKQTAHNTPFQDENEIINGQESSSESVLDITIDEDEDLYVPGSSEYSSETDDVRIVLC